MKPIGRDVLRGRPRRLRLVPNTRSCDPQPGESLIELLTRDLEAWRLAKGVIEKASARS